MTVFGATEKEKTCQGRNRIEEEELPEAMLLGKKTKIHQPETPTARFSPADARVVYPLLGKTGPGKNRLVFMKGGKAQKGKTRTCLHNPYEG